MIHPFIVCETTAWCSHRGVAQVNITVALLAQPGTTLTRPDRSRKNVGDGGQARDVQLHHRQHRLERSIRKGTLQSVAGVVDQDVDRNASLTESLMQLDDCRNI